MHAPRHRLRFRHSIILLGSVVSLVASAGCRDDRRVLTADMPLHLEDHLEAATIEGSAIPNPIPAAVEWRFDQPQPEWQARTYPDRKGAVLSCATDALRVMLPADGNRDANGVLHGNIYIDLPDWRREDWAQIVVRARTTGVRDMMVGLNPGEASRPGATSAPTFRINGGTTPLVGDGIVHTYEVRPNWRAEPTGPWRRLGFDFRAASPGSLDLLSVRVVPARAVYADPPHGVRSITVGERKGRVTSRALYVHAPARVSYRVRIPAGARLDGRLGVLAHEAPVTFRITVQGTGSKATLFEERHGDARQWIDRSVDLSAYGGQTVTLALETDARTAGTVAFWGAPTLSGVRPSTKPNVIFYVIDSGGADQMSVYGYNRRTTPNLERLAQQGAVFERAYSNSSWTVPSTTSFMTSLHNSVIGTGGLDVGRSQGLPAEARTMAERFHEAGYLTAVLTTNSAGSNLERSVDTFRASWEDEPSSAMLARGFWDWRGRFPGEPYWVHIQTTDVHGGDETRPPPFAGLFASPTEVSQLERWDAMLNEWEDRNAAQIRADPPSRERKWVETGVSRIAFNQIERSLYDEMMAHQDYQIGKLVEGLQRSGQWSNTLLIVAADHSIEGGYSEFLVPLVETPPPDWQVPILRSSESRVPLIFIWPQGITGGQRFSQPVSMIDVLPTVLDLAGLPQPDILQGQSLAPLLLGRAGWKPRPVIFDEFEKDPTTGEPRGRIEIIDGRWGASLWIGPPENVLNHRPMPLLLFDVWNDPLALTLMNDAHPELVKKYSALLEDQWKAHRALATQFTPGAKVALTPEQLERLRALGYIR